MHRPLALAVLAVATLLLTACTPAPEAEAPPTASVHAPFDSDDDAFAAANETLSRYIEVANEIQQDGGRDPERIAPVSLRSFADASIESFEELAAEGSRQVGAITYDSPQYESQYRDGTSHIVAVNVCMDFSDRTVIAADGTELDLSDVAPRTAFRVELSNGESEDPATLKMKGIEPWLERAC